MNKYLFTLTLLVVMLMVIFVDPSIANDPPPPPSAPDQSPVGIAWLVLISGFTLGMFALRKKR